MRNLIISLLLTFSTLWQGSVMVPYWNTDVLNTSREDGFACWADCRFVQYMNRNQQVFNSKIELRAGARLQKVLDNPTALAALREKSPTMTIGLRASTRELLTRGLVNLYKVTHYHMQSWYDDSDSELQAAKLELARARTLAENERDVYVRDLCGVAYASVAPIPEAERILREIADSGSPREPTLGLTAGRDLVLMLESEGRRNDAEFARRRTMAMYKSLKSTIRFQDVDARFEDATGVRFSDTYLANGYNPPIHKKDGGD